MTGPLAPPPGERDVVVRVYEVVARAGHLACGAGTAPGDDSVIRCGCGAVLAVAVPGPGGAR